MKDLRKGISVVVKISLVICCIIGLILNILKDIANDEYISMLYFTIQSNIWIAVACLAGAVCIITKKTIREWMYVIKLVFTVAITLTGFVYCFILAPSMGEGVWDARNILLHVAVPVLAVVDFLLFDSQYPYRYQQSFYVAIPPLYYILFAAIGYLGNWNFGGGNNYPYFFLNWGSPAGAFGFSKDIPYIGVVWWCIVLILFLAAVASLYIALAHRIRKSAGTAGNGISASDI